MSMKHVPPFLPSISLENLKETLHHHSASFDAAADRLKVAAAAGDARAMNEAQHDMNIYARQMAVRMDDVLIYLSTIETPEVQA